MLLWNKTFTGLPRHPKHPHPLRLPFDSAQGPAFGNSGSREIPGGLIPKLGRYGTAGKNEGTRRAAAFRAKALDIFGHPINTFALHLDEWRKKHPEDCHGGDVTGWKEGMRLAYQNGMA